MNKQGVLAGFQNMPEDIILPKAFVDLALCILIF